MVSLEVISILLSGIAISASLFYYSNVLANATKTQQITTYIQTLGFRNKEFLQVWTEIFTQKYDNLEEWESKYGIEVNPDSYAAFWSIASRFQSVGYLVYRGVLSPEIVYEQEGVMVIMSWEAQRLVVEGIKNRRKHSHFFNHYKMLYEHMIRLRTIPT